MRLIHLSIRSEGCRKIDRLRNCSNNLNQIAKRVNSTGHLYEEDIADLKTRYGELWGAFGSLLSKLEDL